MCKWSIVWFYQYTIFIWEGKCAETNNLSFNGKFSYLLTSSKCSNLWSFSIENLFISHFDPKIIRFTRIISLQGRQKSSLKTYNIPPHNLLKMLMLQQLVNILPAIKLSSVFLTRFKDLQTTRNYTHICCPFHCSS